MKKKFEYFDLIGTGLVPASPGAKPNPAFFPVSNLNHGRTLYEQGVVTPLFRLKLKKRYREWRRKRIKGEGNSDGTSQPYFLKG